VAVFVAVWSQWLKGRLTLKRASGAILDAMAECCCPPPLAQSTRTCPVCAGRTLAVDLATIKALLKPEALGQLQMVTFRFCPEPACDTVYVSDTGQVFRVHDVRVPVWQKLRPGDRMLCYCFGETELDLHSQIAAAAVLARVRAHIAERRCACDVRNPRGSCCLGDLTAAITRLHALPEVKP
jgi:hypothetical protein